MLITLSPEERIRITELQAALDRLIALEEKIKKELRALVYKIEKI